MRWLLPFFFVVGLVAGLSAAPHLGRTAAEWRTDLASADRLDRLLAARALGEMAITGDDDATDAVIASLNHDDSAVRYWAAVALAEIGERARPAEVQLLTALRDSTPEVRIRAAFALARLGRESEAVPLLIRELSSPEKAARLLAAHALDDLDEKGRPAITAFESVLDDEFNYVQRIARHALWELGARPCPYQQCD